MSFLEFPNHFRPNLLVGFLVIRFYQHLFFEVSLMHCKKMFSKNILERRYSQKGKNGFCKKYFVFEKNPQSEIILLISVEIFCRKENTQFSSRIFSPIPDFGHDAHKRLQSRWCLEKSMCWV